MSFDYEKWEADRREKRQYVERNTHSAEHEQALIDAIKASDGDLSEYEVRMKATTLLRERVGERDERDGEYVGYGHALWLTSFLASQPQIKRREGKSKYGRTVTLLAYDEDYDALEVSAD